MSDQFYLEWKGWDRPFDFGPDDADQFRGEIGDVRGLRVLDIGFGEGRLLGWARATGAIAAVGVERGELFAAAAKDKGIVTHDDLADVDGPFDLIIAFDVMEHLTRDDIERTLDRCSELIAPQGRLIARFPNMQSPLGLALQFGDPTHLTALSVPIFSEIARARGWAARGRASYQPRGRGAKRLVRALRRLAQHAIAAFGRLVYPGDHLQSANVTLELRRSDR